MYQATTLTDKARILAYLETDRLYAAYAIGDLEPGMFEQTTWAGAEAGGRLQALALCFRGLSLPVLFLMGDSDGLRTVLEDGLQPERTYINCRPQHLGLTRDFYAWDEVAAMWRMVLEPAHFRPVQNDCLRLEPARANLLTELYDFGGGGGAFSPAQVQQGVFYGAFLDGQLVAAAGTHLVSPTYGVAAVGNVFTHPKHRGRGYGTAATSAVTAELLRQGIHDVVLNVNQGNAPAIHVYERLGFHRYCDFLEGSATAQERT
jgi:RimJ/RimL family protein N-acetyltransferase